MLALSQVPAIMYEEMQSTHDEMTFTVEVKIPPFHIYYEMANKSHLYLSQMHMRQKHRAPQNTNTKLLLPRSLQEFHSSFIRHQPDSVAERLQRLYQHLSLLDSFREDSQHSQRPTDGIERFVDEVAVLDRDDRFIDV